ncbi:hypothetical protein SynA1560_00619 [Synechococcus sp. A15-60]|nr:hypothetical protein SynA1560_00619 [Synechococcus sp. A15-60]
MEASDRKPTLAIGPAVGTGRKHQDSPAELHWQTRWQTVKLNAFGGQAIPGCRAIGSRETESTIP